MDWLAAATGVVALPDGEGADEARAKLETALRAEAANFLAAGGRLSPAEWASLTVASRRAFVAAASEIEADRATLLAATILRLQTGAGA